MAYSTEASLKAEWGVEEVESILASEPATRADRLEKAVKAAEGEINGYLHSAGYITPFVYTQYGSVPPPDGSAPLLDGALQAAADAFTMFNLANRTDFQKKQYLDAYMRWKAWFEQVRLGEVRLVLMGVEGPTGSGNVRVIARPTVFYKHLKREDDIFR